MKKSLIFFTAILSLLVGSVICMYMMNRNQNMREQAEMKTENEIQISDKVSDECVDEYDELQEKIVEEANSNEEEKLSPNATITFEKFYKDCEHTIKNIEKIPNSLVNATKDNVEEKYETWTVKEFSKDKVTLFKELDGECGEHYMLRDVDGKINIYKLDEIGNEILLEETEIFTEYLTSVDKINMENGLIVYGKESLNKLLEDYE